jgi:hypothetical protein
MKLKTKVLLFVTVPVLSVLIYGCDTSWNPTRSLMLNTPHSGTWIENDLGAIVHAYGVTESTIVSPESDAKAMLCVDFNIAESTMVWVWIVAIEDVRDSYVLNGGATFISPAGTPVRTLVSSMVEAGGSSICWDGRDERGNPVPDGIYRVYIQAGDLREWHDYVLCQQLWGT